MQLWILFVGLTALVVAEGALISKPQNKNEKLFTPTAEAKGDGPIEPKGSEAPETSIPKEAPTLPRPEALLPETQMEESGGESNATKAQLVEATPVEIQNVTDPCPEPNMALGYCMEHYEKLCEFEKVPKPSTYSQGFFMDGIPRAVRYCDNGASLAFRKNSPVCWYGECKCNPGFFRTKHNTCVHQHECPPMC